MVRHGFNPMFSRGDIAEAPHLNMWLSVVDDIRLGVNHPIAVTLLHTLALLLEKKMTVEPYSVIYLVSVLANNG